MAAIYGGAACEDPALLYRSCAARGIPTESWFGKANGFDLAPVGRGPGRGWLLLRKSALDGLSRTSDHDLTFSGTATDRVYTLKKVVLLFARCVTPGAESDPNAVYLAEVADRRHHLARIPIDKAYNVRSADGASHLTQTLNSGSAWTWQQVIDNLVTALGLTTSQFTLPFTPNATPENLSYWGSFAWEALNDVLDRIAYGVKYDAEADEFSVVRLGTADDDSDGAMADAAGDKVWDAYPLDPDRAWRPEKVRVLFLRRPRPADGSTPYYAVDVTLSAGTGVVAGSYGQLFDDLAALGAAGTPSNSAACSTRAAERAGDWLRKREGYARGLLRVYRDFLPGVVRDVPGAAVGSVALDDRGGPMRTEVASADDRALEGWSPLSRLPPWFPPDAAGGGGSGYTTVQDEGTPRAARTVINFIGGGVQATDDAANNRTNVTVHTASTSQEGTVSISAQQFLGNKTFFNSVYVNAAGTSNGTFLAVHDGHTDGYALEVRSFPIASGIGARNVACFATGASPLPGVFSVYGMIHLTAIAEETRAGGDGFYLSSDQTAVRQPLYFDSSVFPFQRRWAMVPLGNVPGQIAYWDGDQWNILPVPGNGTYTLQLSVAGGVGTLAWV